MTDLPGRGLDEVGAMVGVLCSERASFAAGANLRVDGNSVSSMGT